MLLLLLMMMMMIGDRLRRAVRVHLDLLRGSGDSHDGGNGKQGLEHTHGGGGGGGGGWSLVAAVVVVGLSVHATPPSVPLPQQLRCFCRRLLLSRPYVPRGRRLHPPPPTSLLHATPSRWAVGARGSTKIEQYVTCCNRHQLSVGVMIGMCYNCEIG